ncbi:S24 family peptidase [Campylobacter jejuni]|uniref:S24 family peptidase n=2 Tax=Campylobacteraceae TaxID=72294 RepID=A0A5C4YCY9_CAMJU|nr:S24 family peptidase [Campylobacter jejuni]ECL1891181.1 S24 family peptidase [Campylobacter coli]EAI4846035.1 S24 family peptidase [Campylobacter jejuni]EAI6346090.1 S24 family peptidase [Campylobacter jejuni]EAI8595454.1 S24 family peptidase [Campylobacter jejuni]
MLFIKELKYYTSLKTSCQVKKLFLGKNMKEYDKRIIEEMKEYFGVESILQVAEKLGYKPSTANNWHNKGLTQSVIDKFQSIKYKNSKNSLKNSNMVNFRYFPNVYAAAGYGNFNENEHYEIISLDAKFVVDFLGLSAKTDYDIIRIFGNSMEPYLLDGQSAIVDFKKNNLSLVKNTDVIIISIDNELFCKRIKKQPLLNKFTLTSDNKDYDDIVVTENDFDRCKIIGVVVCKMDIQMFLNKIELKKY